MDYLIYIMGGKEGGYDLVCRWNHTICGRVENMRKTLNWLSSSSKEELYEYVMDKAHVETFFNLKSSNMSANTDDSERFYRGAWKPLTAKLEQQYNVELYLEDEVDWDLVNSIRRERASSTVWGSMEPNRGKRVLKKVKVGKSEQRVGKLLIPAI